MPASTSVTDRKHTRDNVIIRLSKFHNTQGSAHPTDSLTLFCKKILFCYTVRKTLAQIM